VGYFLLDWEAAAGDSVSFASHAAWRNGLQSVKVVVQNITMILAIGKSNNNSPVLQPMLTILPFRQNSLSVTGEHVVLTLLAFVPTCLKFRGRCCLWGLVLYTLSFKAWTNIASYGRGFNSFVVLCANVFETLVSRAGGLRDFLGEVSSVAPISLDVSSVSTFRFLTCFCLAAILLCSASWLNSVWCRQHITYAPSTAYIHLEPCSWHFTLVFF
jgi:hypothetical protein